ncbi:MAG: Putative cytochrome P450 hydroxylase, partial [uncultured Corynebacteriales bacterium]
VPVEQHLRPGRPARPVLLGPAAGRAGADLPADAGPAAPGAPPPAGRRVHAGGRLPRRGHPRRHRRGQPPAVRLLLGRRDEHPRPARRVQRVLRLHDQHGQPGARPAAADRGPGVRARHGAGVRGRGDRHGPADRRRAAGARRRRVRAPGRRRDAHRRAQHDDGAAERRLRVPLPAVEHGGRRAGPRLRAPGPGRDGGPAGLARARRLHRAAERGAQGPAARRPHHQAGPRPGGGGGADPPGAGGVLHPARGGRHGDHPQRHLARPAAADPPPGPEAAAARRPARPPRRRRGGGPAGGHPDQLDAARRHPGLRAERHPLPGRRQALPLLLVGQPRRDRLRGAGPLRHQPGPEPAPDVRLDRTALLPGRAPGPDGDHRPVPGAADPGAGDPRGRRAAAAGVQLHRGHQAPRVRLL